MFIPIIAENARRMITLYKLMCDHSFQNIFYKVPKLSKVSSDEYILPQMFDKFGFKESNAHPLNLLNRTKHSIKIEQPFFLASSSESKLMSIEHIQIHDLVFVITIQKFFNQLRMNPTIIRLQLSLSIYSICFLIFIHHMSQVTHQ